VDGWLGGWVGGGAAGTVSRLQLQPLGGQHKFSTCKCAAGERNRPASLLPWLHISIVRLVAAV
jgi:hypothetical protein